MRAGLFAFVRGLIDASGLNSHRLALSSGISGFRHGGIMDRTAVVTGGTRGLGRAIALALRDGGCRVAATYHSDDEAARRMQEETGIAVFRWDVADFDACAAGLDQVAQALGPIDILVNNAAVTAD